NVLLARLRAHLRQHESSEDAVFQIGPYTFKPSSKLLVVNANGKKVRLTEKEAAILKYLYRAEGQIVPRDRLLSEVWGYNANVTTHTLETHVYRLRQKIEANPAKAVILVTEGGGYKLVPSVSPRPMPEGKGGRWGDEMLEGRKVEPAVSAKRDVHTDAHPHAHVHAKDELVVHFHGVRGTIACPGGEY